MKICYEKKYFLFILIGLQILFCAAEQVDSIKKFGYDMIILESYKNSERGGNYEKYLYLVKNASSFQKRFYEDQITKTETIAGIFQATKHLKDLKRNNIKDWKVWRYSNENIEYRNIILFLKSGEVYFLERKYK